MQMRNIFFWFLFWKHGLSAVSGIEENIAERGPLATIGVSLAILIKKLRNDGASRCGWLYQNPKPPKITPKNTTATEIQKNTKKSISFERAQVLHSVYFAGRDNSPLRQQQVGPNTMRIYTDNLRVETILDIPSFDKKFQVHHQQICLSLLHSIGIQVSPVEFWLHPYQWCQAAKGPPRHLHQWMMGHCLQI